MIAAFALVVMSACLHAGWNLIARRRGSSALMLRIPLYTGLIGLAPALAAELRDPRLSPALLGLLALTGAAQAVYYLALGRAYASSDFAQVYPLSRALPVLLLAGFDLARGRGLSALGLGGMTLIGAGCALAPLASLASRRGSAPRRALQPGARWIGLVVLATVSFSMVDKLSLESLPKGASMAARYSVWEALATLPFLWALSAGAKTAKGHLRAGAEDTRGAGPWGLLAAAFSFGSYGLVLWAYQMSAQTSYVAALRQMSIPLGVAASRAILGERATTPHLVAAVIVSAGVGCLLAGG